MSSAAAKSAIADVDDHVQAWAKSLAQALSEGLGAPSVCEVVFQPPADAPAPADDDLWVTATWSGGPSGELSFRMASIAARRLAGATEGPEQTLSAERKEAVLGWFQKAGALVAAQQKGAGHDVQLALECGTAPSWSASASYWLQASLPAQVAIELRLNDALLESLQGTRGHPPNFAPGADSAASKLGMLMDVELMVTIRFGGRRMLLKDILDLCTGSVVDLDQEVQEPVDLLLDGKLIARGEVVVVDGNYGMRITEVPSNTSH